MEDNIQRFSQVFFPENINDLFSTWKRFPGANLYSGGTSFLQNQSKNKISLSKNIILLTKIDELKKINRSERYLELGPMVTIADILALGKIVPLVLINAINMLSVPQQRNIITIGGSICDNGCFSLPAAMIAVGALYEFRTSTDISPSWISAARFSNLNTAENKDDLLKNVNKLLTRIRIPLENWDITLCKYFPACPPDDYSSGFAVFLARIQKNILTDNTFVFSGSNGGIMPENEIITLRDKNNENNLTGNKLPLDKKVITLYFEQWQEFLNGFPAIGDFMKTRLFNFIKHTIDSLAN